METRVMRSFIDSSFMTRFVEFLPFIRLALNGNEEKLEIAESVVWLTIARSRFSFNILHLSRIAMTSRPAKANVMRYRISTEFSLLQRIRNWLFDFVCFPLLFVASQLGCINASSAHQRPSGGRRELQGKEGGKKVSRTFFHLLCVCHVRNWIYCLIKSK